MGLTVKKDAELGPRIPAGVYIARCFGVVDLGTHRQEKYGNERRKILIIWEIPDIRITLDNGTDVPATISRKYTASLGDKASLRRDLEAWRGRAFTAEELENFDLKKVLTTNCQIQVIHNTKEGRTYSNIGSIMAIPKGATHLKPESPLLWFSFEEGGFPPSYMPSWILEQIHASNEWQEQDLPQAEPLDEEPF